MVLEHLEQFFLAYLVEHTVRIEVENAVLPFVNISQGVFESRIFIEHNMADFPAPFKLFRGVVNSRKRALAGKRRKQQKNCKD